MAEPFNPAFQALLPATPNRILAILPEGYAADQIAHQAIQATFETNSAQTEWQRITDGCWAFLNRHEALRRFLEPERDRWAFQVGNFWQTSWQAWPYERNQEVMDVFARTPVGKTVIEKKQAASDWLVAYQLASHRFDARRQTRNFEGWRGVRNVEKDSLSGLSEAIIGGDWLTLLRAEAKRFRDNEHLQILSHLFRTDESLGAINIIKRVWHRSYLEECRRFKKFIGTRGPKGDSYFNIPSVPGIAAHPWARAVRKDLQETDVLRNFIAALEPMDQFVELDLAKREHRETDQHWLRRVDWQVFQERFWESEICYAQEQGDVEHLKAAQNGLNALRVLRQRKDLGAPERYYAVLAMDGDGMGRWLSGEKLNFDLEEQFHKDFSRALALTALGEQSAFDSEIENAAAGAKALVEDKKELGAEKNYPFEGKIIYAGADDILALLPASQAVRCARAMNRVFSRYMSDQTGRKGFTISAGIALGHIKEPLQDMVEAAERELRRAKSEFGGNAVAISAFKRSGETIEVAMRFDSAAMDLLEFFQGTVEEDSGPEKPEEKSRYRRDAANAASEPPITGRFPHRVSELLQRYETYEYSNGFLDLSRPKPLTEEVKKVAGKEFEFVVGRQAEKLSAAERVRFLELAEKCLGELLPKKAESPGSGEKGRPLRDFYNLFNLEAFITRQAE